MTEQQQKEKIKSLKEGREIIAFCISEYQESVDKYREELLHAITSIKEFKESDKLLEGQLKLFEK